MKQRQVFYQHIGFLFRFYSVLIPLTLIISLVYAYVGIRYEVIGVLAALGFILIYLPLVIITIRIIHSRRKYFSKVVIDEVGVEGCYKDQVLWSFQWSDVVSVIKFTPVNSTYQKIRFVIEHNTENKEGSSYELYFSKRMLTSLLFYCSEDEVVRKLEAFR